MSKRPGEQKYVIRTGGGSLFGPFDAAEDAAKFLVENYNNMAGAPHIECIWSPLVFSNQAWKDSEAA